MAVGIGSAVQFVSGQISTIGAGSELTLDGNNAFVEDSTALGSNSAVTGLTDIAGFLNLENGASLSTAGALTNAGSVNVYTGAGEPFRSPAC